jgi:replicative DNA helicase
MSTDTAPAPAGQGGAAERTPPNDVDAEQCVLGGMMMSKDAVADVIEVVKASDFYHPRHVVLFTTITELYADNEPTDSVAVANRLGRNNDLVKVGGAGYLHTCLAAVPTAANAPYYAGIVADLALLRRVIEGGTRVAQLGYAANGTGREVMDRAQQLMFDLDADRRQGGWGQFQDLLQPALDEIEAAGAAKGRLRGLPTGFADLDKLLNGLRNSQLILVGGRPGQGKSTAGVDFARNLTMKHNIPVAFFSMEMDQTELVTRILSAEARVPLDTLLSGDLTDDDWTKLARRMGEISEAPLFIDDTAPATLVEIRAKARRLKQLHDIKLIVIDHFHLFEPAKKYGSDQEMYADHSRQVKLLAKELRIPVVCLVQLNRNVEGRTDKTPQLSDLRGSGSLEQDADVVILLHRDDYYDKQSPRAGEADFIVAKHRNGPTETVTVAAQLHLSRFVDMAI